MRHRIRHLAAFCLLLAVASCNVAMQGLTVPTQATSGTVFEVRVTVNFSGTAGIAYGVLQLPNGFSVVGHASTTTEPVLVNAAPTSIYTAEPGTFLVGFSGGNSGTTSTAQGTVQVFVRTTPGLTGTFAIKAALGVSAGGSWVTQDPVQTQFSLINDAAHSQSIAIVPAAFGDFAFDSDGLPAPTSNAVRPWSFSTCADLDGDGNADIVALHSATGLRHFRSQPHNTPPLPGTVWTEQPRILPPGAPSARCAVADLDGDGAMDLMRGDGTPIFGNGAQWTIGAGLPVARSGMNSVAIGDVDNDGLLDVALGGGASSTTLQVFLNNGNRTFRDSSIGLPDFPGQPPVRNQVLLADLDGDGNLDLFWATTSGTFAFRGDGHGGWITTNVPPTGFVGDAVASDIDGDGVLEVVTAFGNVLRYFGLNTFTFVFGTGLESIGSNSPWIRAFDFDRDGDQDLVVATNQFAPEIWRNDGTGRFARHLSSGLPAMLVPLITDLAVGDIDGNGWPDLVVTTDGAGVFAFQNLNTGIAPFGRGCAGTGAQEPTLRAIGAPTLGNATFALQLHCGTGPVLGGIWFDADRTHLGALALPLDLAPFGAPGCDLLVPPTFLTLGLSDPAGVFTAALPVPAVPALERVTVFAQGCAFVSGANPTGKVFTAGLALRIH